MLARKHPAAVYRIEVSDDGTKVLTVASLHLDQARSETPDPEFPEWQFSESVAYVWDASTGKNLLHPERVMAWDVRVSEAPWVRVAALSPDGTKLATNRPPAGVTVWSTGTGKALSHAWMGADRPSDPATGIVTEVLFSPGSRKFLTLGPLGSAKLWDVSEGHAGPERGDGTPRTYPSDPDDLEWTPLAATFSLDGRRLLMSAEGIAAVLDAESGAVLLRLEAGPVSRAEVPMAERKTPAMALSPDGRRVAAGFASDGYTAVWEVPEGKRP